MDFTTIIKNIFLYQPENPISFISGFFLILFTLFIIFFSLVYKHNSIRKWLLIIFNMFFYYKLCGSACLIILIPVVVDYFIARQLDRNKSSIIRKVLLFASMGVSLGLLIYFKYTNGLIEFINSFGGKHFSTLKLLIPVGISYFVFRTISYVIDVYNEKIESVRDFSDYLLYMTFFPLLISGPITRAELFIPQINRQTGISGDDINHGIYYIFKGIIKKAIIADYLGMYVNIIFSLSSGYTGFENLMGVMGFAMQIYFDFSGYTDIAIGISTLLGFNIGINFNEPFKAHSITDFWRRWHISLSDWLRDYIFIPLNFYLRKWKKLGSVLAITLTFLICGIWHGASWTFIFWGLFYGLALSWEILTKDLMIKAGKYIHKNIISSIGWIFTFAFVVSMLVLLRAENMQSAMNIYSRIFTNMDLYYVPPFITVRYLYVIVFCLSFFLIFMPHTLKEKCTTLFIKSPLIIKVIAFLIVSQLIIEFQNQDMQSFLYTKF